MPSIGLLHANFNQKLVTFLSSARHFSIAKVLEFFSDEQRGLSLVEFFLFSFFVLVIVF